MNILQYENRREEKIHADTRFPYNIYLCSIPKDFRLVPLHWHQEMELISIKKGNGMVSLEQCSCAVDEGDLVIVFPGKLHSIRQKPGFSMEYENIIFRLDMLMPALPDNCSSEFLMPLLSEDGPQSFVWKRGNGEYEKLQKSIGFLDDLSDSRPFGYPLAIKGIFFQLLFLILGNMQQSQEGGKDALFGEKGNALEMKQNKKIKHVLKEIEVRYGENLTIQEMAGLCGYSPSHFMRFFRQHMGSSFVEYLNDYRLIMASHQLAHGEAGISEIAQNTGFDQPSYFNRLFKRKYGMTPKQYRKEACGTGERMV